MSDKFDFIIDGTGYKMYDDNLAESVATISISPKPTPEQEVSLKLIGKEIDENFTKIVCYIYNLQIKVKELNDKIDSLSKR